VSRLPPASPAIRVLAAAACAVLLTDRAGLGAGFRPGNSRSRSVQEAAAPRSALPAIVITGAADAVDEAVVTVPLPATLVGESFVLRDDADGPAIVTQLLRDRTLAVTVRDLAPREVRRLRLEPALDRLVTGPIAAREHDGGVDLTIDGRLVAGYRTQPALSLAADPPPGGGRGGYLHPLVSPAGRVVTGDGAPGQPEERGVWSAWGSSRLDGRTPDFWHTAEGRGAVEFEDLLDTFSGPVVAGFTARHRAVDRTVHPPVTAETELWRVTVPALGRVGRPHRVIDLTVRHEVVTRSPLTIAAAALGNLGVRGPAGWSGTTGMAVITSEGRTRSSASRTRARWIAIAGLVGGTNAGLAILDHPDNLRHPQPVFVDPRHPFVSYAPMQLGAFTLAPLQELPLRYRLVTFDGFPDRAWIERLWQAYAHPPTAVFAPGVR
jgi:hypothetical protein